MEQWVHYLLFALGLVFIIKGSDWFIEAVIWTATVFKIPYIIIGATIVSVCTTMPETFVSLAASIKGETDMALGNAIGSIALNTGLIMGLLLLFAKPVLENRKAFKRNGAFLVSVLMLALFSTIYFGEIGKGLGIIFIGLLLFYLYSNYRQARTLKNWEKEYDIEEKLDPADTQVIAEGAVYDKSEGDIDVSKNVVLKKIFFFAVGITGVIVGSSLLVDNGIKIAQQLGIPSIVIAVTFTALGTSLPELVTAITSIRKKVSTLGIGNIIGANILNVVQVVGISSIVQPIPVGHDLSIQRFQFPMVLLLVGLTLIFGLFWKNGFKRWHGIALLLIYCFYLAVNLMRESAPILGEIFF
jgi:cation:H+ antiporter